MPHGTIVALATPKGKSAIALIRMSGDMCADLFKILVASEKFSPKTFYHRKYLSSNGHAIDDVLTVFFAAPNSYTGEDSVEIHCHGNTLIVEKILEDLIHRGCRLAEPGEFTKRAFLNGKLDLCQAEAVADIIHGSSERAIAIAQNQLNGALSEKIGVLSKSLVGALAEIEREIDFSDGEEVDGKVLQSVALKIEKIGEELGDLADSNKYRSAIDNGIATVILGAPNAGKSSLFNLLIGEDRAIVSEIAGTTRDVVSEKITIGGHVLRICDTAGLRCDTPCEIEKIGMGKAVAQAKDAALFLIVLDANGKKLPIFPGEVANLFTAKNTLLIINKIDLERNCDGANFLPQVDRVEISIKNAASPRALKDKIAQIISRNDLLGHDVDIAVNVRHADILHRAHESLLAAKASLARKMDVEIIAEDIRQALELLGEIVGSYGTEQMLDAVFSNFCVGK